MAKRKGEHKSDKEQYAAYKANARYAKNKKAKLERHIKRFPNDVAAQEALKQVGGSPTRKPSKNKVWSAPKIETARLLAKVGLNGHMALGGKFEAAYQDDVIGYDAPHVLDQKKIKPSKKDK